MKIFRKKETPCEPPPLYPILGQTGTISPGDCALQQIFNKASVVIDGLEKLKNEPGSTFSYTIDQRMLGDRPWFQIETNITYEIPDMFGVWELKTTIDYNSDNDTFVSDFGRSEKCKESPKNAHRLVEFVARHAKQQGLVK